MKTILVVEDNDMMRENTSEILQLSNYAVVSATNGRQGLELALDEHPDLIICDIMMPEMDGLELLRKVRSTDSIKKTPFVLVSARAEKSDIIEGFDHGANEYLTKPFEGDELLSVVGKYMHNSAHPA